MRVVELVAITLLGALTMRDSRRVYRFEGAILVAGYVRARTRLSN